MDVPQSLAETVEVVRFAPRERVQQRTAEQVVDVPQSLAETVGVVRFAPRERVQQRTAEQVVDVPQSPAETVQVVRFAWRGCCTRSRGANLTTPTVSARD